MLCLFFEKAFKKAKKACCGGLASCVLRMTREAFEVEGGFNAGVGPEHNQTYNYKMCDNGNSGAFAPGAEKALV